MSLRVEVCRVLKFKEGHSGAKRIVAGQTSAASTSPSPFVAASFEAVDTNQDGVITRAEFQQAANSGPELELRPLSQRALHQPRPHLSSWQCAREVADECSGDRRAANVRPSKLFNEQQKHVKLVNTTVQKSIVALAQVRFANAASWCPCVCASGSSGRAF